ncbi:phosphodiester glycosidase family protein [Aureibaculum algae]|uniref:Phosphodiester glycosidase family protein n=1 Tax=Aureibaculum algae TaxID=2584122 RepID=A0A5B7TWN8_9FLAO|nr:phosphodiester glycosidase family protein [Aureibaculum algae]QCX39763.1 phosphodiester glycosidase family protein [Aureibaculum algae]
MISNFYKIDDVNCYNLIIVFFIFYPFFSFSQEKLVKKSTYIDQNLIHLQIIDSLNGNQQFINILKFPNSNLDSLELNSEKGLNKLDRTSTISQDFNAIAAVNGGFFNMKTGDLITYFEKNDSVLYKTISDSIRRSKDDYFLNGAIVIDDNNELRLEVAKSDLFYKNSDAERMVMVTGPMLLKNRLPLKLAEIPFVTNKHPRTCICTSNDEIFLITIDGRRELARGMNLLELQNYLLDLGCIDALNLDGGGSTTMWIKNRGVVNIPSDKNGERSVSNNLMIIKKS